MFEQEPALEVISILGKLGPFKDELPAAWRWVRGLGPRSQVKQDIMKRQAEASPHVRQ